jgi:hypothetical protein
MKRIITILLVFLLLVQVFGLVWKIQPVRADTEKPSESPISSNPEYVDDNTAANNQKVSEAQPIIVQSAMNESELQLLETRTGVGAEGQNYNQLVDGHGTGLAPPTEVEWKAIENGASVIDQISTTSQSSPSSWDNTASSWFPPIGNQGQEGSCVAWAVGYYTKTFQEAKEHNWNVKSGGMQNEITSPSFIYNLINNGVDGGSSYYDAIGLVCSVGACSLATMPYNAGDYTSWPSAIAWNEAPQYRANASSISYLMLQDDAGLANLKAWLSSSNLATIGVDASKIQDPFWGWSNLDGNDMLTLDNYVNPTVNHAGTIVGYNDNFAYTEQGQTHYGAFKIANSWGIPSLPSPFSWEHILDGCYWISYDAMKQSVGYCMVYSDRIGYVPTLTASFQIAHPMRGECNIEIGMGTSDNPIVSKSFTDYIYGGNQPFCSNNIVFDISEFEDTVPDVYGKQFFLRVYDGGSAATGTILYFSVGNNVSSNPPVNTLNGGYVFADLTLAGTIYIMADGSIDPAYAPIATADNVTYSMTDRINGSIVVERDCIVINGSGYSLQGSGSGDGITNYQGMSIALTIENIETHGFNEGIWLFNGDPEGGISCSVIRSNITNNSVGISCSGIRVSCSVAQSNITNNGVGIELMSMHTGFDISANSIVNNSGDGILLGDCVGQIYGNKIANNGGSGIYASDATCFIYENNVTGNSGDGINLGLGGGGQIYENNITDNKGSGIRLGATMNQIFHNNFIANGNQVSYPASNTWDNGYPSGGNYWSNYNGTDAYEGPGQNQTGGDGIGDTPYIIDSNNKDNYPLIRPWSASTYTLTFYTYPSSSGSISCGGSTCLNGQTGQYAAGSYSVTANLPPGWIFSGWVTTGGVSISGSTATVTGAGSIKAVFVLSLLFSNGFEEGSVNVPPWWGQTSTGTVMTVQNSLKHGGSYALQVSGLGSAGDYGFAYYGLSGTEFTASEWCMFNGTLPTASGSYWILTPRFASTAGPAYLVADPIYNFATHKFGIRYWGTIGVVTAYETGTSPISAGIWYQLTLYIKSADAGTITLWVGGSSKLTVNADTNTRAIGSVCCGANYLQVAEASDRTIFIDDFQVNVGYVPPIVTTYAITFLTSPATVGSITLGGITYTNGQTGYYALGYYTVSANVPSDYILQLWAMTGGVSISGSTVTVTGSGSLTAVFTPAYNITFYTDPSTSGSITCGGSTYSNGQTGQYALGSYTVSANAPAGYSFGSWVTTGGVSIAGSTATVTGTGSLEAIFTPVATYTVTFYTQPSSSGSITFAGHTYTNGQTGQYAAGMYPLGANVPSGYAFSGWVTTGGASVSGSTANITGAGSVQAVFVASSLFSDGFEEGSIAIPPWSGQSSTGTVLAVQSSIRHSGSYALQVFGLGAAGDYGFAYYGLSGTEFTASEWYMFNGTLATASGSYWILTPRFASTSGPAYLVADPIYNFATQKFGIRYWGTTGVVTAYETGTSPISAGVWYQLTLYIKSANSGIITLWVGGSSKLTVNADTNTRTIGSVCCGANYLQVAEASDRTILVDDFQVNVGYNPPNTTTYSIAFLTNPASVGSVIFGGSTYSNGSIGQFAAGTYSVSANASIGYAFSSWVTTGGVSISGSTATVTGTGSVEAMFVPSSSLFSDGFEEGSIAIPPWSGQSSTGTALAVQGTIKHSGSYALQVSGLGSAGDYGFVYYGLSGNEFTASEWYMFNGTLPTASGSYWILTPRFASTAGPAYLVADPIYNFATQKFGIRYWGPSGVVIVYESGTSPISAGTWYHLTLYIKSAASGIITLWVNGLSKLTVNAVTNTRTIGYVCYGANYLQTNEATDRVILIDDCTVDVGYVPPT